MGRLTRDVLLGIQLATTCSRNQYTGDPGPVIDELRRIAGDRVDILAQEAGSWAGYYDSEYTRPLAAALSQIDGAEPWVAEGRRRREIPTHGTPPPTRA
ncbi:hypothetical protein [Microbacterium allomyrinae]|uniref:Uncharacterized protein n=1 Tax=Microbacterium allomyrinae TaxID=2830666 RepID=A0A9X1LWM6_9MICO|nr:hypothetical protein [Microbacterium allomyrinae]MCC2033051.1 hypothetical protein [Microbacterium allomyrinae]